MKKIYVGISLVAVMIGGCVTYTPPTPPPPKVYLNQYDLESAEVLMNKEGKNTIKGNAFLRQKGGGIVTCAGSDVNLFPKTAYSTEYLEEKFKNEYYLYGTFSGGKGYKESGNNLFNPYSASGSKETQCDSQGNFEFVGVGDGEYYVITMVNWSVSGKLGLALQGGNLVQQVKVQRNETKKVILNQ